MEQERDLNDNTAQLQQEAINNPNALELVEIDLDGRKEQGQRRKKGTVGFYRVNWCEI